MSDESKRSQFNRWWSQFGVNSMPPSDAAWYAWLERDRLAEVAAAPEERAHKCKARETIEYAITLLEVHGGNPKVIEYLRAGLDQHEAAPPMNNG